MGTTCAVDTYLKCKEGETCSVTEFPVDKATVLSTYPDEISKYEEDLEADSIDNWIRPKVATMKMINE